MIWRQEDKCERPCRVQSLFSSLGDEVKGKTIALGGDGRYFNKEAAQIICKIAAGNGLKKVRVLVMAMLLRVFALDAFVQNPSPTSTRCG